MKMDPRAVQAWAEVSEAGPRIDGRKRIFDSALAYYPERLAAFRDALQEQGFDPETSDSLTEVLFDHLLAATLRNKP